MHQSVIDKWHGFSVDLEGRVPTMYLDVVCLITVGVGCLIDPVSLALGLPWKRPDKTLATQQEIRAAWNALKARPDLARRHVSHAAALTGGLHLSEQDIDLLVARRLLQNEQDLRRAYPYWDEFPADAQLGMLSMAWAVGSGFPKKFPSFTRAVLAGDWLGAQAECKIREVAIDGVTPNPGIIPRNKRNHVCFGNAHAVLEHDLARDVVYWPAVATAESAQPTEAAPPPIPEPNDHIHAAMLAGEILRRLDSDRRAAALRELSGNEPHDTDHDELRPSDDGEVGA